MRGAGAIRRGPTGMLVLATFAAIAGCGAGHRAPSGPPPTWQVPCTSTSAGCAWPNAANTGVPAGMTLLPVPGPAGHATRKGNGWHWDSRGWVQVTKAGVTLSGLDIDGSLHSSVSGLTVADTRIRCTGEQSWCVSLGSASTVRDSEIGGGRDGHTYGPAIGLLSGRYDATITPNVIDRVDIHHTVHGMRIDGDTAVLNSYVHDLPMGDAPFQDAHTDGIMTTAGGDSLIRHNTLEGGNNCVVFVQWDAGNRPIGAYTVQDNQFIAVTRNGQRSSFGVCVQDIGIDGPVKLTGNTFSRGWHVGPIQAPAGASVSGNTFRGGTPVPVAQSS